MRLCLLAIALAALNLGILRTTFSPAQWTSNAEGLRPLYAVSSTLLMVNLLIYASWRRFNNTHDPARQRFWTAFLLGGSVATALTAAFFLFARLDHVVNLTQAIANALQKLPGYTQLMRHPQDSPLIGAMLILIDGATLSAIFTTPQLLIALLSARLATSPRTSPKGRGRPKAA